MKIGKAFARGIRGCVLALAAAAVPAFAADAAWPARPLTMVVVFAPGGAADIVARAVAVAVSRDIGQQIVVENRPGAGGTVGATVVAHAKPDGYTMLQLVSSHTTAETLFRSRDYDLVRDFAPISTIGTSPYWLLVNPEVTHAKTLGDLVAAARARPGKLTYASGGSGGITHLASEMMKLQGKLDLVHVPFKGNAPALTEVMAGRVDMIFDQPASSEGYVKAGKLRPLAVTSRERIAGYPDVPTMAEAGFPGFEAISFFGLAFPAGTPKAIVDAMNRAVVKALASPDLRQKLIAAGVTPAPSTPEAFAARIAGEIVRWRTVITDAKVTTE